MLEFLFSDKRCDIAANIAVQYVRWTFYSVDIVLLECVDNVIRVNAVNLFVLDNSNEIARSLNHVPFFEKFHAGGEFGFFKWIRLGCFMEIFNPIR